MEALLNNSESSLLVELFCYYSQLVARKKVNLVHFSETARKYMATGDIKLPTLPSLLAPERIISDPIGICSYLAELSFTSQILIGENHDAELLSIYELCQTIKKNPDVAYKHFNQDLLTKVFLLENHVTLADLILFSFIYSNVTIFDDATKWKYNNLFRWFNNIQNLDGVKQFLEKTGRSRSAYPEVVNEAATEAGAKSNKKK